jgi:hypothetical protein
MFLQIVMYILMFSKLCVLINKVVILFCSLLKINNLQTVKICHYMLIECCYFQEIFLIRKNDLILSRIRVVTIDGVWIG